MHNLVLKGSRRTRSCTLPADWSDVTPRQFGQWLHWQERGADEADLFGLFLLWSGLTYRDLLALDDEQRLALVSLLTWVGSPPVRWLATVPVSMKGPGDGLDDLLFGQYVQAEVAYARLLEGDETALKDLYNALYIEKWHWGWYIPTPLLLRAVALNYAGARSEPARLFKNLFTSGEGDGESGGTWLDVGLSLARQTTALGTYAQLEQTNLYLVLTTLAQIVDEHQKLKALSTK